MSKVPQISNLKDQDAALLVSAGVHLGVKNCTSKMRKYVYGTRKDGVHVFDLKKTWNKLNLAARIIAGIDVRSDVVVVGSKTFAQRAVLKFSKYTGAHAVAGKFVPGSFTNCLAKGYREPRILIVADPRDDMQAIRETTLVNMAVIAFCDTDSPLKNVDIVIPCNNRSIEAIGTMWRFLAREVLHYRGEHPRTFPWDIMCDMFFHRSADLAEKEQEAKNLANNASNNQTNSTHAVTTASQSNDAWGTNSMHMVADDAWKNMEANASENQNAEPVW